MAETLVITSIADLQEADIIAARIVTLTIQAEELEAAHKAHLNALKRSQQLELEPIDAQIAQLRGELEIWCIDHPEYYPAKRVVGEGSYGLRQIPETPDIAEDFDPLEIGAKLGLNLALPVVPRVDRAAVLSALKSGEIIPGAAIRPAHPALDIKINKRKPQA